MLRARWIIVAGVAAAASACISPLHRAPVEDRVVGERAPRPFNDTRPAAGNDTAAPAEAEPEPAAPSRRPATVAGAENAGKPGYYVVKQGDTLLRVSLETGHNWRDIQKWNNLEPGQVLEIGQVLRVVPPGQDPAAVVTRPVAAPPAPPRNAEPAAPPAASGLAGGAATSPAAVAAGAAAATTGAAAATGASPGSNARPAAAAGGGNNTAAGGDENVAWMWPAGGPVIGSFDEARAAKGILIGGSAGDPVWAAADGQVVYAGSGLMRHGNVVIIKHNATYLTAYAHNRALLVKEDQLVKRGQKIAEMGSSDAPRVQLHFEMRRLGKPIDPARMLPPR